MIGGWRNRRSSFLAIISSALSSTSVARWRKVSSAVALLSSSFSSSGGFCEHAPPVEVEHARVERLLERRAEDTLGQLRRRT